MKTGSRPFMPLNSCLAPNSSWFKQPPCVQIMHEMKPAQSPKRIHQEVVCDAVIMEASAVVHFS